jgi:hypothetical protein
MLSSMSGISDLEIYQRFNAIAEEFDRLYASSPSLIGGTALTTATRTLRGMAQAIYEHSLMVADDGPPQ